MAKFFTIIFLFGSIQVLAQKKNIYHKGWIDFNKILLNRLIKEQTIFFRK